MFERIKNASSKLKTLGTNQAPPLVMAVAFTLYWVVPHFSSSDVLPVIERDQVAILVVLGIIFLISLYISFVTPGNRYWNTMKGNLAFLPILCTVMLFAILTRSGDELIRRVGSAFLLGFVVWYGAVTVVSWFTASRWDETRRELERIKSRHSARIDELWHESQGNTRPHREQARAWHGPPVPVPPDDPDPIYNGNGWIKEQDGSECKKLQSDIESVPWYAIDTGISVLHWSRRVSQLHQDVLASLIKIVDEQPNIGPETPPAADARKHLRDYVRDTRFRLLANSEVTGAQATQMRTTETRRFLGFITLTKASKPDPPLSTEPLSWQEETANNLKTLESALEGPLSNDPTNVEARNARDTLHQLPMIEKSIDEYILGSEERLATLGRDLITAIIITTTIVFILLAIAVKYGATAVSLESALTFFIVGVAGGQVFRLRPSNTLEVANVPTYSVPRLATFQSILVSGLVGVLVVTYVPVVEALTDSDLILVAPVCEPQLDDDTADSSSPTAESSVPDATAPVATSAATPVPGTAEPAPTSQSGELEEPRATPTPVDDCEPQDAAASDGQAQDAETASSDDEDEPRTFGDLYGFNNIVGYALAFGFGALPGLFFQSVHSNISSIAQAIGSLEARFQKRA